MSLSHGRALNFRPKRDGNGVILYLLNFEFFVILYIIGLLYLKNVYKLI